MYDYINKIVEFIKENFVPASNAEEANVKMTSDELLNFLFKTFPEGCISDYELNEIMLKLNYKRETYTIATEVAQSKKEKESNFEIKYSYQLATGWCMNSFVLKDKMLNN